MLAEIRKLNPKPGSGFENTILESVIPDVVVRPAPNCTWQVELNPDALPRILVNQNYVTAVGKGSKASDKDQAFLSECLQNANWLTRSLDQRARTIVQGRLRDRPPAGRLPAARRRPSASAQPQDRGRRDQDA